MMLCCIIISRMMAGERNGDDTLLTAPKDYR